ncbi:phage holin family protein [Cellulomonas sp. URHE0023]|uniref:phage holin family protein n=1 Tax=Cellulomonas sp. URHE0023 TaxID=1380354 RepID=UPI000480AFD7|nr:phage holin family protein [Cellulomonas sp. URHE0023]
MTTQSGPPGDERSLGKLVSEISETGARLVRAEIELFKAEIAGRAQKIGIGAGLLAAAGLLALYFLAAAIATAIIALALVVDLWLAALIVTVLLLLVVAVLALIGIRSIKKGTPPSPIRAIESVQEDIDAIKTGIRS